MIAPEVPTILTVYVPVPGSRAEKVILPRSGIVGTPMENGRVRTDYAGYREQAPSNIRNFADRVLTAAGRHTFNWPEGYPTIARSWFAQEELIEVGHWDVHHLTVDPLMERLQDLMRWLGVKELSIEELQATCFRGWI